MRPTLPYAIAACFTLILGGCDDPVAQTESLRVAAPHATTIENAVGKIAYVVKAGDTDFDIYVGNPDGTGLVDVSNSDDWDTGLDFSPNARRIVFCSNRDGDVFDGDIFVMNVDGDDLERLTDFGSACNPHWAPSGQRIAFESGHGPDGDFDIYVMNADGRDVINLTDDNESGDAKPVWSPNGRQIAFTSRRRDPATAGLDIHVMDADGGNVRRLTRAPDDGSDLPWSWSPDGKWIAFYRTGGGPSDVYIVNADGVGQPIKLTNGPLAGGSLGAWSPNGRQIAFSRNNRPFIMDADGSDAEAIPLPAALDGKIVSAYDWSHR
jgi:TolB protein